MLEIQKDQKGNFRFVVKSAEGHTLIESVSFDNEEAARRSLQHLKPRVKHPSSIERKTNHDGRFQFTLKDSLGKVVGHSQLYSSEAGMENGITHIRDRISRDHLKA